VSSFTRETGPPIGRARVKGTPGHRGFAFLGTVKVTASGVRRRAAAIEEEGAMSQQQT
jgi:hypothetical protein